MTHILLRDEKHNFIYQCINHRIINRKMKEEENLQAKNDESGLNPPVAVEKKRPASDEHVPSQKTKRQHTSMPRTRIDWDTRFDELVEYKEKHGDCKVPYNFEKMNGLGKWAAKQRQQYKALKEGKHSTMTPCRLEKLNSVGFVWQVRTSLGRNKNELRR